jgi:hypothetical protein
MIELLETASRAWTCLSGASLGQITDDEDLCRCREGANHLPKLEYELLSQDHCRSTKRQKKIDGFSVTKANMACPVNSSAVPMIVVSATPLCIIKADSIILSS